ncbi:MAG: fumarylacetoacetate hydrolase family protein [Pseudomonadales bacterium]
MKLASLKQGGRDGTLVVVSRNLSRAVIVDDVAAHLQGVLESWHSLAPQLADIYQALNCGKIKGFELDAAQLAAPLPRTYQWLDGSAYLPHVELVRKARGSELPEQLLTDPLMYQGGGDSLLGPRDAIPLGDESWGLDFESEIGVLTDDVPMGVSPAEAGTHIKLLVLINDVSLRELIPAELAKGFGFLQGKPSSALSPVAVTTDELGDAWDGTRLNLPLLTMLNGELFGQPEAGQDMHFSFPELISHAAKTRRLSAGTLIGSGTVSNRDSRRGASCLVEKRVIEIVSKGKPETEYMKVGDRVRIEMRDRQGDSVFGAIEQEVVPWQR